jgi:predicted MFS family arabinose efflux permease
LGTTFAALRHPNYRLWFAGQMVSLLGTWMQTTAQGFLVYELTRSPAYLGTVGFAAGLPVWLFTLWGGVVAERARRRDILLVTQTAMMILALVLAGLTFSGAVRPWHVVLLALGLGTANAFDGPARQSFVVELVGREDLTNAIALNATMFNIGTTVGPAVAGVVYAALGPGWCFAINGLSFIAVIVALSRMRLEHGRPPTRTGSAVRELGQGLSFVAHHQSIRMLILGLAVTSLFGMPTLTTLSPAWAAKVLHGDASTNGLLLSARGLGSLAGAIMIASFGNSLRRGRLRALGSTLLPLAMFVFAALRLLPFSLATLVAAGLSFMMFVNMTNALVQTQVPDQLRGRVMGIYTLTFFGLMPIGALLAGTLAERLGEPQTIVVGGAVLLGFALVERLLFPRMRALV